jgi:superfamily II DNA or RNA helicase
VPLQTLSPLPLRWPPGWIQRTTAAGQIVYLHLRQPGVTRAALAPLRRGWWQAVDAEQRAIYTDGRAVRYQHPQVLGTRYMVPPGWEQLVDGAGLVFYQDHLHLCTQRHPPPCEPFAVDIPWDPLHAMYALHPQPHFGAVHQLTGVALPTALAPLDVECGQFPHSVKVLLPAPSAVTTVARFWQRVGSVPSPPWQHLVVQYKSQRRRILRLGPSRLSLRPTVQLWPHQQQALRRLVDVHGGMRSGMLVVPCGGGKTLLGIAIATLVPAPVLVLCHNATSALQWRQQFRQWSTGGHIVTALHTAELERADVAILTYKMVSTASSANKHAQALLLKRQWSVVILDEVHGAPSVEVTGQILTQLRAGALIGVTATPLREDARLALVYRHVGELLFEVPWMTLQHQGLLNPIQCTAVHCPLAPAWSEAYRAASTEMERQLLSALHPAKVQCCRLLLQRHAGAGVLLFFEELLALQWYARALGLPSITGSTALQVQTQLLLGFAHGRHDCLAFSRAGDTSLDLPRASVVIQISSHHGSRRQEVQRLGRISRIAPGKPPSRFYTLISTDTKEAEDTVRRQLYPTAQGYAYTQEVAEAAESTEEPAARLAAALALGVLPPAPPKPSRAPTKKTLRQRLARRK